MNPYIEEAIEYLESFDVIVSKYSIRRILEEWICNCHSHIGREAHEHERTCGIIDMTSMSWEEQDEQMREKITNYGNALVELENMDM